MPMRTLDCIGSVSANIECAFEGFSNLDVALQDAIADFKLNHEDYIEIYEAH